jgi:hypothetical protein
MYGMVNKAVQDMVVGRFGPDTWDRIAEAAGFDEGSFVAMQQYPDQVTYDLVGAASRELNIPSGQLLEAFGEYWVLYTSREGYGDLLKMTGPTLRDCLKNLDMLHARVGLSFPQLQPPSFRCVDLNERNMEVRYYSHRAGLAPLVTGLLKGLAKSYETPVDVSLVTPRGEGADHDVFLVSFPQPQV